MKTFLIISSIVYLITVTLQMIYGLHMFQLNGYKNKVHRKWLQSNGRKFTIVIPVFLWSVVTALLYNGITAAILLFLYAITVVYFLKLVKQKAKKKLVYTKRVIRLIITLSILNLLVVAAAGLLSFVFSLEKVSLILLGFFAMSLQAEIILANCINAPVEKAVNQHFINDAKRLLKSAPDLCVIGVTGSYGKTSVKFYLDALLRAKYNVLTTPESYNTPMGVVKTIRESLSPLHEIFICEMGAKNIGDIKELCDIVHPTHGVITSIGPQHLESFLSVDNVLKTKFELADSLPEKGILFLNGDNEYIQSYALENKKYKNTVPYATTLVSNGYKAQIKTVTRKGTVFDVITPEGETKEFTTRLIGSHNVINVLGAIAVANTLGITLEELLLPVRKLSPVEHRLQLIERNNITIIDDAYNSNPTGAQAALDTLAMFAETKILVTPGMIELGAKEDEYNYEFGRAAARVCDYIILVGRKQTASIQRGVLEEGFPNEKLYVADDLTDAMNHAYLIQSEERKIILLENDLPDNY